MANLLLLAVRLPGDTSRVCGGFILFSDTEGECEIAFRKDWWTLASPDEAEVLNGIEETLQDMAVGISASTFVQVVEDRLSNTIQCYDRMTIPTTLSLREHADLLRPALIPELVGPIGVLPSLPTI